MKKIFFCFLIAFMAFAIMPGELKAGTTSVKTELPIDPINKENLINKLDEVKIPKESMEKIREKKLSPKRMKEIASDLGGIYIGISVSLLMLILIIILLIIVM